MNSRYALGWLSALALGTALVGFGCSTSATGGHSDGGGVSTVDASGGGGGNVDSGGGGGPTIDAGGSSMGPDAGAMSAAMLGMSCDPTKQPPSGYHCIILKMGATTGYLSPECSMAMSLTDPACNNGYTGPGQPACAVKLQNGSLACLVFCSDSTSNHQFCDAMTCNGMCPGTMSCTLPAAKDSSGNVVAKACQP